MRSPKRKNTIEERLAGFGRQQFAVRLLSSLLLGLTLGAIILLVCLIQLKPLWLSLFGLPMPFLFVRRPSPAEAARFLERHEPTLSGHLLNSLQLSQMPDDAGENYSSELIAAAQDITMRALASLDLRRYLDWSAVRRGTGMLMVILAFLTGYAAVAPGRCYYGLTRQLKLFARADRTTGVPGDAVGLVLNAYGPYLPGQAELEILAGGSRRRTELLLVEGRAEERIRLDAATIGRFRVLDRVTEFVKIDVDAPLRLRELWLRYEFPAYTKLPTESTSRPEVNAVAGTMVHFRGLVSGPIDSGYFISGDDTIDVSTGPASFSFTIKVKQNSEGRLVVKRTDSLVQSITINALPDLGPWVEIMTPDARISLPASMTIPVTARAVDDFGFSRGDLVFELHGKTERHPLRVNRQASLETLQLDWDLKSVGFMPGDEVPYWIEIWDNDAVSGPKRARSRQGRVYFPSVEQIYQDVAKTEGQLIQELTVLEERQDELGREVERIETKGKQAKKLDWSDQRQLEAVVGRQEEIARRTGEWVAELERTIDQLEKGLIMDHETVRRLEELSALMKEMMPEQYQALLDRLKEQRAPDPDRLNRDLGELKAVQDRIKKNIERTIELLKRFRHEERLKELARQAQALLEQQRSVETLKRQEERTARQGSVKNGLTEMEDALSRLGREPELEPEFALKLDSLAGTMSEEQLAAKAGRAEQAMRQGDRAQADRLGQEVAAGLEKLRRELDALHDRLVQQRRDAVKQDMARRVEDLLAISREEEKLIPGGVEEPGARQQALKEATRRLADSLFGTQKKTMFVGSDIGRGLARSLTLMNNAQQSFEAGQNDAGQSQATAALAQLNATAQQLISALQEASGSGSSTGVDALKSALSGLSFEQMMINQSLEGLMPVPIDGMTPAMQEQLGRLAARQRALREALEGLSQQLSENGLRAGLEELARSMADSEKRLYEHQLDRQLIERQQELLGRLLDAQESIRKQRSTKRMAEVGRDQKNRSPANRWPDDLGQRKRRLQEELMKSLGEGYPPEYERLIRAYFDELMR